jgi:hypothetical protein
MGCYASKLTGHASGMTIPGGNGRSRSLVDWNLAVSALRQINAEIAARALIGDASCAIAGLNDKHGDKGEVQAKGAQSWSMQQQDCLSRPNRFGSSRPCVSRIRTTACGDDRRVSPQCSSVD